MVYYVCFPSNGLEDHEAYVETSLKEAQKYESYIKIETKTPEQKKGICLGTITVKEDN